MADKLYVAIGSLVRLHGVMYRCQKDPDQTEFGGCAGRCALSGTAECSMVCCTVQDRQEDSTSVLFVLADAAEHANELQEMVNKLKDYLGEKT